MSELKKARSAVKVLNEHLQQRNCSTRDYRLGYEALFELIDQDWTEVEIDPAYKDGYEHCMIDLVDAIADEWGIPVWSMVEEQP